MNENPFQKKYPSLNGIYQFFKGDKYALAGLIIYLFFIFVAIFAPVLANHDPHKMLRDKGRIAFNHVPSEEYLLGTTNMGRDIYSQLIYGTRPALLVGFSAAFIVMVVGTFVGLIAGYYDGHIGSFLMRITDVAYGIPFEPFVIVLVAFLGPDIQNIVFSIGLLLWRDTARVIRAQVLTVRKRGFVEAARVSGASDLRIMFVHIAPNILGLSFLYGTFAIGWAILTEAAISFLGFGDPTVISWGYMLQDAYVSQALSRGSYFWFAPPGLCIMMIVMAGFYIGRGSEEILYPRLKRN